MDLKSSDKAVAMTLITYAAPRVSSQLERDTCLSINQDTKPWDDFRQRGIITCHINNCVTELR